MSSSVRWAFNLAKWEPSEQEFSFAVSCLQVDEKARLDKFVYKKDVKASLIGRLLMRKYVSETTGIPYNTVEFSRDNYDKPTYKALPDTPKVNFNVSHHGSYTVLAGEIESRTVGVDIMKLEYTGGKALNEFFRIMNRNFTSDEWKTIRGTNISEQKQIANFCRNWALKESYTKALSIGVSADLNKLNFKIQSELQENRITRDTCLYVNGEKQDYTFEESLIDKDHCVAVALDSTDFDTNSSICDNFFKVLSFQQVMDKSVPRSSPDLEYTKRFFLKEPCPS
ncbi:hypothetical protein TSAR_003030 [Trichomalopsis sarcophagae]|uniref:L-aminoadipate-semialdehyde dehydrogenase-phosphopantetheinyl transferase n=1 Tax=Trichomalopsis sarcophagae TaxID=543379 RepID=A0A232FH59_9HYME|nr:hypothetical protein TSAR_003030 [Trichomalopsis sarcophagae]